MLKSILKMRSVVAVAICLAGLTMFSGCDPKGGNANMQKVTLKGRVKDISGIAISGVRVTTGSLNTLTDAKGEFSFTQAEVINSRAVIKFEKSGYFTLTRSGVKENEMFINVALYPKGNSNISLKTSFNSASAKTLEVSTGMKVKLSASSIMRADGSAYSGNVNADMLYLDPNNEKFPDLMPGGDLAAIRSDNSETMLISWGMNNVSLTDDSGNPLQIKGDVPAELTFPIPEGMENNPPATIPLWHFDEAKGIWTESGVATLSGTVYKGTVTHFSWVNLDEPAKRVTLKGKVICEGNKPVPFVSVKAGQTASATNSKGEYSVVVPANTPITVIVTANGGSDSKNVPGQPGNTTYNVPNLVIPCNSEGGGEPGTYVKMEKGAIKYQAQGGNIWIITFKDHGMRFRWDMFNANEDPDSQTTYIINHYTQTYWIGNNDSNNEGYWEDYPYSYAGTPGDFGSVFFGLNEADYASFQQGTITIAGKICNKYVFNSSDYQIIIAFWNGMTMLYEINGDVLFVATKAVIDAPDSAFTKTFIITWI